MSALASIQAAVVARLESSVPLMALLAGKGVYDGKAPDEDENHLPTPLPYIVVGESTESPVGVLGGAGYTDTLTLHIWSDYPGAKQGLDILALLNAALAAPLTIAGHTQARMKFEFVTTLVEEDGLRHVPVRYRVFTFANA